MSLDGRTSSSGVIDQEQLDQRLSRLIMDHNNYRSLLSRYIRRALSLCTWFIDQDYPSFYQRFERTDKLVNLVAYIRDHALQSYQAVDRAGTALLSHVDILLARATMPPTAGSPLAGGMSPSTRTPFNNSRLLYLAGEVKEAIRFWREQYYCAQSMTPKIFEMERIAELRYLALTGDGSTIEEKARGVRISCEQARLVTEELEPFLDQWYAKLSIVERPKEDHMQGHLAGYGLNHAGVMSAGAPLGASGIPLDHRSHSTHGLDSPAISYSSQPWGQGAS